MTTQGEADSESVFGEGFAEMFSGSPHGADAPKEPEALPVEVPGQTDAKAAADGTEAKADAAPDAKADEAAKDKPAAPPGVIAERRRAQAAERENHALAARLERIEQFNQQLMSRLQPQQRPDFVTNPDEARELMMREAAAYGRHEAQRVLEAQEANRAAAYVHSTANQSMAQAAQVHGEDVVTAALDWAKATGKAGPQSPYLGSADPYADLLSDFTTHVRVQAKVLGLAPAAKATAASAAASKTSASELQIPPMLAGATPAGAAAQRTVKDDDSWFGDMFRPG